MLQAMPQASTSNALPTYLPTYLQLQEQKKEQKMNDQICGKPVKNSPVASRQPPLFTLQNCLAYLTTSLSTKTGEDRKSIARLIRQRLYRTLKAFEAKNGESLRELATRVDYLKAPDELRGHGTVDWYFRQAHREIRAFGDELLKEATARQFPRVPFDQTPNSETTKACPHRWAYRDATDGTESSSALTPCPHPDCAPRPTPLSGLVGRTLAGLEEKRR